MPGAFQQITKGFAPPWMDHGNMGTLLEAIGSQLDANARQVLDARMYANPYAAGAQLATGELIQCPPFVLPIHAEQRGIALYPTEPEESRRLRTSQWLQLHRRRGTHLGEMQHVQPFWLPGVLPWIRIVFQDHNGSPNRAQWHTLSPTGQYTIAQASPSNWVWDNHPEMRTRFWAIVYLPPGYTDYFNWNDGTEWDGGGIWDGVPYAVLNDIYQAIADWKSAHSWFAGLIVTQLQPTDLIPGTSVHPFDPLSSSTTNADQSTNLPIGNWWTLSYLTGANAGLVTRPPWATFFRIDNGY